MNWTDDRRLARESWPHLAGRCPSVLPGRGAEVRCEHRPGHPSTVKHTAKLERPALVYVEWVDELADA